MDGWTDARLIAISPKPFVSGDKNVRTVFFNNYIPIQVVNKQFGLKNNNNHLLVDVADFAQAALMFELLKYYSSEEKYRGLCGSAIN